MLTLLLETVWNSVVSVATEDRRLLHVLQYSVASYYGATLKVTELFSKAILMPMFVYGDCMWLK